MDIREIKALAELMTAHGLGCIELEEGNLKLRLERAGSTTCAPAAAPAIQQTIVTEASAAVSAEPAPAGTPVCAPMIGVYYASPAPDAPPFVTAGSAVQKGDVLCVIEAMKLLNEVVAECDGTVSRVCLKNGDVAEYGQPLFYIE